MIVTINRFILVLLSNLFLLQYELFWDAVNRRVYIYKAVKAKGVTKNLELRIRERRSEESGFWTGLNVAL